MHAQRDFCSSLPPSPSRRSFLKAAAAGLSGAALPGALAGCTSAGAAADRYVGLRSDRYLGAARVETRVPGEAVFTEGPAVDRFGRVFFTNIPAGEILRWEPETRRLSVFRQHSGGANGLLFTPEGDLLACEGGAGRITRTDMQTGEVAVLADGYGGRPLQAPNDLARDAQGRIYFSSRSGEVPPEANPKGVYRIDPGGSVHALLREPEVQMPNGIALSPDGGTLYLIEAHPDAGHHRHLRAYDLGTDGTLSNDRVIYDFYPGRSGDGMAVDAEGNLYVAAGLHRPRGTSETLDTRPGIHVIAPPGRLLAYAPTPEDTVTNCTFGGEDRRTLYVTAGPLLLSLPTRIPGAA